MTGGAGTKLVPVTHRLCDYSLDIPMFLLREPDGKLRYPTAPVPLLLTEYHMFTKSKPDEHALNRWGWPESEADNRAAAEILAAEAASAKGQKKAADEKRKAEKAEKRQVLDAAKAASRKNFLQHFKWDWEK